MGVDYSGGMIVGEIGSKIKVPAGCDGLGEWADDNDMTWMSPWYDADYEDCYFGFTVKNVPVSEITGEWMEDVQKKAAKFKELTGVDALLIGTQNIY